MKLLTAGNLPDRTSSGGNPEVARASVEDHIEGLARSPQFNRSVILSLGENISIVLG